MDEVSITNYERQMIDHPNAERLSKRNPILFRTNERACDAFSAGVLGKIKK